MQFIDLAAQYNRVKAEMDAAVINVMNQGVFIMGDEVATFEARLAKYVGRRHCIAVGNGTDALVLSLKALGIGAGDAVFVPDFTFFASAECASVLGATPIFVDVLQDTFNMDADDLERKILAVKKDGVLNAKAVIPVDLFGQPADYTKIEPLAKQHNIIVIEDAAQGFGGSINGKKAGAFGTLATTSFFPAKPLGCYGDGGAIFTDDDALAELLRSLHVHGKGSHKYDNVRIGYNSRLDTMQAAILNVKLNIFDDELAKRQVVAETYTAQLKGHISTPVVAQGMVSSYAQYTLQCENRQALQAALAAAGIPSNIYYPKAMHMQSVYSGLNVNDADCKVSTALCEAVLAIPMHPYLSEEEIITIANVIKSV